MRQWDTHEARPWTEATDPSSTSNQCSHIVQMLQIMIPYQH